MGQVIRLAAACAVLAVGCASSAAYYRGPPRRIEVAVQRETPVLELGASRVDETHVELRARSSTAVAQQRTVVHSTAAIRDGFSRSVPLELSELVAGVLALPFPTLWAGLDPGLPPSSDVEVESLPVMVSLLSPVHSVFSPRQRLGVSDDRRFRDPKVRRRFTTYAPAPARHVRYRALGATGAVLASGEATTDALGRVTIAPIGADTVVLDLAADGFAGMIPIEPPDKLDLASARQRWASRPPPISLPPEAPLAEVLIPAAPPPVRILGRNDYRGPSWRVDTRFGFESRDVPYVTPFLGAAGIESRRSAFGRLLFAAWPYFSTHAGVALTAATGFTVGDVYGELGAIVRVGVRRVGLLFDAEAGHQWWRDVDDPREPRRHVGGAIDLCLTGVIAASERFRRGYCGLSLRAGAGWNDFGSVGGARVYSLEVAFPFEGAHAFVSVATSADEPIIGDPEGYPLVDGDRGRSVDLVWGIQWESFGNRY